MDILYVLSFRVYILTHIFTDPHGRIIPPRDRHKIKPHRTIRITCFLSEYFVSLKWYKFHFMRTSKFLSPELEHSWIIIFRFKDEWNKTLEFFNSTQCENYSIITQRIRNKYKRRFEGHTRIYACRKNDVSVSLNNKYIINYSNMYYKSCQ